MSKPTSLPEQIIWSELNDEQKKALLDWCRDECANLSGADLRRADLSGADLSRADLSDADLSDADLRGADLSGADLSGADLSRADLSGADLSRADLSDTDLRRADLSRADLSDTDLSRADLSRADLSNVRNIEYADAITRILPEGDLIGWKKCRDNVIVKLAIPADAKRSNSTGRKCRAEFAKVLEVIGAEVGLSTYTDKSTVEYRAGETVHCDKWDENRWEECSGGIHFFITRYEAEHY
jgi:hypothetical protein